MNIPIKLVSNAQPFKPGDEVWVTKGGGRQRYEVLKVNGADIYCLNLATGNKTWLSSDEVTRA